MTVTFENYGNFYVGLNYTDGTELTYGGDESKPMNIKEAMDFLEEKMREDLTVINAFLCDAETGEIVATLERENEDFADEDWYADEWRDDYDEVGFNPYMGCYDFDC